MNRSKMIQVAMFALTVLIMSNFMGWIMALSIFGMILFHEMGHVAAARYFGATSHGIFILPFVGGVATISGKLSRYENAIVSLWGPLHGLLFSYAFVLAFIFTGNPIFLSISQITAIINLFNLLPIGPLDGGQVLKSLAFSLGRRFGKITTIIGLVATIGLAIWFHSPIFIMLALFAILDFQNERFAGFRSYTMTRKDMFKVVLLTLAIWALLLAPLLFFKALI